MGKLPDQGTPFIGERVGFRRAFPGVQRAILRYTETDFGMSPHERVHDFMGNARIACGNPSCQRGGYDFEQTVRQMIESRIATKDVQVSCRGDEGSPKGRRPGRGCLMSMEGTITIEYIPLSDED